MGDWWYNGKFMGHHVHPQCFQSCQVGEWASYSSTLGIAELAGKLCIPFLQIPHSLPPHGIPTTVRDLPAESLLPPSLPWALVRMGCTSAAILFPNRPFLRMEHDKEFQINMCIYKEPPWFPTSHWPCPWWNTESQRTNAQPMISDPVSTSILPRLQRCSCITTTIPDISN